MKTSRVFLNRFPAKFLILALFGSIFLSACSNTATDQEGEAEGISSDSTAELVNEGSENKQSIVSLNGTLTEITAALGLADQIVGTDVTSTYPESLSEVPRLGHVRNLAAEGVLSLKPDLILAKKEELSPELLDQLKAGGAEIKLFEQEYSPEGTKALISEVAEALGKSEEASSLITQVEGPLDGLKEITEKPKVLFIYARGAGTLMVAGEGTPVEKLIKLAGGENAASGFEDFKPLTSEAVLQANPDAVLLFESGLQSLEGIDGLMKVPGLAQTTAGKNKTVITMDGLLLTGFGPRLGEAAAQLNSALSDLNKTEL